MTQREDTQDYVPEISVSEKDKKLEENFLNEEDESIKLEEELLNYVANSKAIFKSQQKDDPDLTFEEKFTIARNLLKKSYYLFLCKFGRYMKKEHLKYFEKSKDEDYEVAYHINRLQRYFNNSTRHIDVRNKRFQALKSLINQGEYFSESEMMKRNPLLYEHLIGRYMTEKEKKKRDNIDTKNITFVNLLMENIDRDVVKKKQKLQEEEEQNAIEEIESDEEENDIPVPKPPSNNEIKLFQWGRIPDVKDPIEHENEAKSSNKSLYSISKTEKQILKEEFVSNMYLNFLEGKDSDFDYSAVDENEAYDNIDLRTQDEEEKYFDSESPETIGPTENVTETESEDELDIYMKSLKEQIATSTHSSDNV